MKSYISYFVLKLKTGLQYRAAAIAGILTQLFFGFIYTSVYIAFYKSDSSNLPMELPKLISYLWLCQAFFSLIYLWHKDKEIIKLIKSGNISYELARPLDLYFVWFSKILGDRLSKVILRFIPVLLIASFLPSPYTLDLQIALPNFFLFLITFSLAAILMTTLILLYHVICLFTLDEKGIINLLMILADLLSGLVIPIPFFPNFLKNIANILPFRYISDFPFRFYVGDISINDCLIGIVMQIIWIIILFIIGKRIANIGFKKAVIQGG